MAVYSHYAPDVLAVSEDRDHAWWVFHHPKVQPDVYRAEIYRLEESLRELPSVPDNVDRLICAKINLGAELMRRGPHEEPNGLEDARSVWSRVHVEALRLADMPQQIGVPHQRLLHERFEVLTLVARFNSTVAHARLDLRGAAESFRSIEQKRRAITPNDTCDLMHKELGDALDRMM